MATVCASCKVSAFQFRTAHSQTVASYMRRAFIHLIIIAFSAVFIGCGSIKELPGSYVVKGNTGLRLELEKDSSFTLYNTARPFFKHAFENDSSLYWVTKGQWKTDKRRLYLTSDEDATYEDRFRVISSDSIHYEGYELIFLDYKFDTLPSVAVYSYETGYFGGRYMNIFQLNYQEMQVNAGDLELIPKDTIEVAFVGYPRVKLPHDVIINRKSTFQLFPVRNDDIFKNHELRVRSSGLFDKAFKYKFLKE